ncbi:HEXXH motif domain-containing protein [Nonomuraea sp. NPDC049714]|uniref:HEXXH motif domain-containing protein n=1 Tax=Nonomuraea sp. NPDC049714 TaxID=3364357 RepID=UPI0037ABC35F
MDPRPHRLPDDVLARLAAGGGGAEAARHLVAAERSKYRLLVLGVARLASDDGLPHAKAVDHAYDVLAGIEKARPEVVRDVLGHPAVGGWAGHTLQALGGGEADPQAPAQLGAIAAAAAVRAGVACWTEAPVTGGTVMLPSLGRIVLADRATGPELVDLRVHADGTVEAGGRRIRVPDGEQPGWQPLRRVRSGDGAFAPLVDDLDPYRWTSETAIEGRLPETELRDWQAGLEPAWRMLTDRHWTIARETGAIISVLTPIQGPPQGMNSASASGRFGAIAMSTPPDGRWLASTFAHEVQHAKLGAVLDVVELLEPDESRHYAPWRDDPRPLSGLIQGAYAYLGVSGFWRRQRAFETDLRPHIEFARWRECAFGVTGTLLDSGRLTPPGRRFVTAMRRTLSAWLAEPVPRAARDAAGQEEAAHRAAWVTRNGGTS